MRSTANLKHTTIRIPQIHIEGLDRIADKEGLDRADIIRRAIKEYLHREEN